MAKLKVLKKKKVVASSGKKKVTTAKASKTSVFDAFAGSAASVDDADKFIDDKEEGFELVRRETYSTAGDAGRRTFLVTPGRPSTGNRDFDFRIEHGFGDDAIKCARTRLKDRWDSCGFCQGYAEHRTPYETLKANPEKETIFDKQKGKGKYYVEVTELTWACKHKMGKPDKNGKRVEVLLAPVLDKERMRDCFLDEETFDKDASKCKECPAFRSCFQGPQFLGISGKTFKESYRPSQKELNEDEPVIKIGNEEIEIHGNISDGWWALSAHVRGLSAKLAKKLAKHTSFLLVMTKTVDSTKEPRFGTSYSYKFKQLKTMIPAWLQQRILERSRDLGEFCAPSTKKESIQAWNDWFKANAVKAAAATDDEKPVCFNDEDVKDDDDECSGENCSYYKKCCSGSSKQDAAVDEMSDDDDDYDDDEMSDDDVDEMQDELLEEEDNDDDDGDDDDDDWGDDD